MGGREFQGQPPRVNDYERIARVIEFLDETYTDQPDLALVAEHIGLSPFHFHRLFSAWAGITPKDFIQCLTLNHAKELLRQGGEHIRCSSRGGFIWIRKAARLVH